MFPEVIAGVLTPVICLWISLICNNPNVALPSWLYSSKVTQVFASALLLILSTFDTQHLL